MEKAKENAPVYGLIAYQDSRGLKYPLKELVSLLMGLKRFVDIMLFHRKAIEKPLVNQRGTCCWSSHMDIPILVCRNRDAGHRKMLLELLGRKFIKPLLSNHALNVTDKNSIVKLHGRSHCRVNC